MKEMIGGCCVCGDERGWNENPLVYCDGHGCNVAVHQGQWINHGWTWDKSLLLLRGMNHNISDLIDIIVILFTLMLLLLIVI